MSIYSTRKSKKQKYEPSGAPGPASASPWRAKRGTHPNLSTFLSQLKGTLWRKNKFSKKNVSQFRKTKRGPFGFFKHPICCKISKKLKGNPFEEKYFLKEVSQCRKKLKGGTLWSHPVWYVTRKNRENLCGPVR